MDRTFRLSIIARRLAVAVFALCVVPTAIGGGSPPPVTFTPLGEFDANSAAKFVSSDGAVVGGLSADATFTWTGPGPIVNLGKLAGAQRAAVASSSSSSGDVVVGTWETLREIPRLSKRNVVRWTLADGWVDLGEPFASSEQWDWESAPRVSANGLAVVAMSAGSDGKTLWRWTAAGWTNLGQAPNAAAWISGSQRLSDDGSVIIANAFNQPFRWTTSGWTGLGTPSASVYFYSTCISSDGSVVVGMVSGSDQQSGTFTNIFRWSSVGGMVNLGSPPFGTLNNEDLFVSGNGLVIAGSGTDLQSGISHLFRLAVGDAIQDLGTLQENHTDADVAAINHDGSVVVGLSKRINIVTGIAQETQTFRWTVAAGMNWVGPLPGGATDARPEALSSDGSVIVGMMGRQLDGSGQFVDMRAFRWTDASGVIDLGSLKTPITPADLSSDGSIVVGSAAFGSVEKSIPMVEFGDHAFRWSSTSGLLDLGVNTVLGEIDSRGESVSGDGSTVVGTMTIDGGLSPLESSSTFTHAFRWTNVGGKVDLGTLPKNAGAFDTSSYLRADFIFPGPDAVSGGGKCVSNDGSVVVGTSHSLLNLVPVRRAFRWTSSGMFSLGTLSAGESSAALAVSSDGLVVVGASGNFENQLVKAFRWTSGNGMQSLGKLPATESSAAFFTSSNGSVVVGTCTGHNGSNFVRKAFRWRAGEMSSLGTLPSGEQDLYWPVAVNDDGSVVLGLSENTNSETGVTSRRAFRWTTAGGMAELPAEITDLHGLSLSGNGAIVVGTRSDGEVGRIACIWTPALGLVDLGTYLVGLGVANVGSLNLNNAAISQDAKSIAVTYQVDGRDSAGIVRGLDFVTSNDDCANAQVVGLGNFNFSTQGATTDGNNPTAGYCGCCGGDFHNDVWFRFVAPSSGIFFASTCDQSTLDSRIDILDGCGGILIACNDDSDLCQTLTSYVEFPAEVGQICLIRVGSYSNSFGSGTLTVARQGDSVHQPTIESVSPTSGPTLGGTAITITGTNLLEASSVSVGGAVATFRVVSATEIAAVTAAGTVGAQTVAVTTPVGTASLPRAFTYTNPAPTIESVSPTSGSTIGGTAITISGTNFSNPSSVSVGGAAATSIVVVSATSITAVTPAGAVGAQEVAVTTSAGTTSLPSAFAYFIPAPTITGVNPTLGAASGGTAITISGTNFSNPSSVSVGGAAATSVVVVSATSITAVTPAGAVGAQAVAVTSAGSTSSLPSAFTYFVPAPTGVAAGDGTSTLHVAVSWNVVVGATGYDVMRDAIKIGSTVGNSAVSFDDTSAVPGTEYSYAVHATSAAASSGASAADTGFRQLSAPTDVACSGGLTDRVSITWSSVVGAASYEIFRDGDAVAVGASATTDFDDTSITIGVNYSYTVRAICTLGSSDQSDPAASGWRAPVAPTGVSASDGSSATDVSVTWNIVTGATGYDVFRDGLKNGSTVGNAAVSFNDITAVAGTSYTYTVRATTAAGSGAPSDGDAGFVGFPVVAPAGVSASDGLFTNKISVSWNATAHAIGYEVFRGPSKIADIASGGTVTYNDIDGSLTPGTSFTYTVKALFTAGVSAPSSSDTGFVGFAIVAPTGVSASDGLFTNKISVSWNAAANANGYQLFRGATKIADIASGATVAYDDVNGSLTPGTSFTYTVKAVFTAGVSAPSASDTGFVGFAIVAPTGLAASDGTITTGVNVTWIDQVGATGYELFRSGTTAPIAVVGVISSYTDTPPLSGKIYSYSVKAIFTAGTSASSASNTGWQNLPAPSAVTATAGTFANKVVVAWLPVTGVTGYKIFRVGSEIAIGSVGSSSLTFSDTAATPGTSYEYFVKATSTAGLSEMSTSQSGYRNLPAPTGVAATDGTSVAFVGVTWVAAPGAVEYEIFRSGTADAIGTSSGTSFNDVGAVAGMLCTYTVKAKGAIGVSAASTGNTGFRALSAPTSVAASDGTSAASVTVTWVASTGATAYKIFRSGSVSAIGTVGAVTTFSDTSAVVGVLYTYTVKAVVGTTGMSEASSGDTGYRNRPAPLNMNATDTDTTKVRVTWSAVTGSTSYEVFRSIGGAPATLIASPTALLFDDTAIARGTTAVYSVRAKFVLTGSSPATTVTTLMSVTNSGTRP